MPKRKPQEPGWLTVYRDWITNFQIDSKESGRVELKLWGTQETLVSELAAGMDEGLRFFLVGKGRQYGVTSALIPLDVLWALVHPGIEGAIIGHKADVLEVCRAQINDIQTRLPESHRVKMKSNSKDRVEWQFADGTVSTIQFLVAGTTERRTDLAKGHGLSFIHGTEVGEWGSETALNSLIASLAQKNPNRLYIFESTGEGSNNLFARMWRHSLDDPERKCIFIPWWTHDLYRIDKRTKLYHHYMDNPQPTDDEIEIVKAAKTWGHELGDDQLAWYRATCTRMTTLEEVKKNYPSVPDDMFQLGGAAFIPGKQLRVTKDAAHGTEFDAYRVNVGTDVSDMQIIPLGKAVDEEDGHARGADLRVWEPPRPRGCYCVSVQPCENEEELASVQVIRCFADSVEQVAEFSRRGMESYHLAWITSYLAGWYKECWVNIDLTYGGRPVFREMQNLRNQLALGALGNPDENIFGSMIFYLYNRIDNVSGGSRTWNWEWNANTEPEAFADFKGSYLNNRMLVHSVPLAEEMGTLVAEDNNVGGDDGADDARCRAMCIGIRTWVDHIRLGMIANKKTREFELRADIGSAPATFLENIVDRFMKQGVADLRVESETSWRR